MLSLDTLISPEYQAANRALYVLEAGYGKGGVKHIDPVAAYADWLSVWSILDYGCGRGTLRRALLQAGYAPSRIREYDPAIPKKATPPKPADLVVCTDVLEHVEPSCLAAVLAHLRSLGRRGGYLSIATRPSNKTLADGRNAHLIIQPPGWWIRQIRQAGWRVLKQQRLRRKYWKPGEPERGVILWLR